MFISFELSPYFLAFFDENILTRTKKMNQAPQNDLPNDIAYIC